MHSASSASLTPSRALITGASSGIGRALALTLSSRDVHCTLVGRERAKLEATARTFPGPSELCVADLCSPESVDALIAYCQDQAFDILVHSAGVLLPGSIGNLCLEDLDRMYQVNLRAPVAITRALLPALRRTKGQVVFINSSAVLRPNPDSAGYAATKSSLRTVADALRDEVNVDGIRVISVFPGRTASDMQREIFEREGRAYVPAKLLQPEDIAHTVVSTLSLPRTAEVTDLHIRPMIKWT